MTEVWDASHVIPTERADALRETIGARVVRVELDLPERAADIRVRVALSDAGSVRICSVQAMPTTVTRTARAAGSDDEPSLFVSLQTTGTSMVLQHGRHALVGPGQFAVYTTSSPYTLLFEHGVRTHFLRFPLARLALPERTVRDVSARVLGSGHPVAALAASYFQHLASDPQLHVHGVADALGPASTELLRAALLAGSGAEVRRAEPTALGVRVMEHLRVHALDRDLSAAGIAAAHHISVRQLYVVLGRADVSLGDWVRSARLEAGRAELARPAAAHRTIASVARGCGFSGATHFSRAFRQAYGLSPGEWRALKQACTPSTRPCTQGHDRAATRP